MVTTSDPKILVASREKIKSTYEKVVANGADPRVVGLWRSKLEQANLLCHEAGVKDEPAPQKLKLPKAPKSASLKPQLLKVNDDGTTAPVDSSVSPKSKGGVAGYCLCGCGAEVYRGRTFAQGHDARFRGYIIKLDKGLLKLADLPGVVQAAIAAGHPAVVKAREHK
jgi:hypothetical protein